MRYKLLVTADRGDTAHAPAETLTRKMTGKGLFSLLHTAEWCARTKEWRVLLDGASESIEATLNEWFLETRDEDAIRNRGFPNGTLLLWNRVH